MYHVKVKDRCFSLLYALSLSIVALPFFTLSFNAHRPVVLLRTSTSLPPLLLFATFPYCPMFSFGICLPSQLLNYNLPLVLFLLAFCTSVQLLLLLRSSSVHTLRFSSTLGTSRCFVRSEMPLPAPGFFVRMLFFVEFSVLDHLYNVTQAFFDY